MKFLTLAATAALALAGSALAQPPATSGGSWATMKAVPVAAQETCATAAAKYAAAAKTHATSTNLDKANGEARTAAADCKAGKNTDGIAAYEAATKLLTT